MDAPPPKPHDPNDLSAYKLDEYDDENPGNGMCTFLPSGI